MKIFLVVLGIAFFLLGTIINILGEDTLTSLMCFLIAVICYGFASLTDAIEKLMEKQ